MSIKTMNRILAKAATTAYYKCWYDSSCQIKRADPALSFKAS